MQVSLERLVQRFVIGCMFPLAIMSVFLVSSSLLGIESGYFSSSLIIAGQIIVPLICSVFAIWNMSRIVKTMRLMEPNNIDTNIKEKISELNASPNFTQSDVHSESVAAEINSLLTNLRDNSKVASDFNQLKPWDGSLLTDISREMSRPLEEAIGPINMAIDKSNSPFMVRRLENARSHLLHVKGLLSNINDFCKLQRKAQEGGYHSATNTGTLNVLIVEDCIEDSSMLCQFLRNALPNVRITVDASGDILQHILRNKRIGYDHVLVDTHHPKLDGLSTLSELSRITVDSQITALTADTSYKNLEDCFMAGADRYLAKPLRIGELVQLFKNDSTDLPQINLSFVEADQSVEISVQE